MYRIWIAEYQEISNSGKWNSSRGGKVARRGVGETGGNRLGFAIAGDNRIMGRDSCGPLRCPAPLANNQVGGRPRL